MLKQFNSYLASIAFLGRGGKINLMRMRDCQEFREILEFAYNPYMTFGVKTNLKRGEITLRGEVINSGDSDISWIAVRDVLEMMENRDYTGHRAVTAVRELLSGLHPDCQYLIHGILNKDFKIGISADTINEAFPGLIPLFSCSLAKDYSDKAARWPMLGEVKWDGKRIIAICKSGEVELYSRNGLLETKFQHIRNEIAAVSEDLGRDFVLDGELMWGMFGKRTEADKVFKVFDYMPLTDWVEQGPWLKQTARSLFLRNSWIKYSIQMKAPHLELSESRMLDSYESALSFYSEIVSLGGEGIMLKNPDSYYIFNRGNHWLKMKPVHDADLPIVGFFEGEGRLEEMLGGFIVDRNGVQVRVGSGFSDESRSYFWKIRESLIGTIAEVRYTETTPDGSLRFPRFVRLRDDK